jgi:hypothetical protein
MSAETSLTLNHKTPVGGTEVLWEEEVFPGREPRGLLVQMLARQQQWTVNGR